MLKTGRRLLHNISHVNVIDCIYSRVKRLYDVHNNGRRSYNVCNNRKRFHNVLVMMGCALKRGGHSNSIMHVHSRVGDTQILSIMSNQARRTLKSVKHEQSSGRDTYCLTRDMPSGYAGTL